MNRPRYYPDHSEHGNLERWLLTYADMITLLTAFFLMMYSMSVVSKGKFTQLASSMRSGFSGEQQGGSSILNGEGPRTTPVGTLKEQEFKQYQQAMSNLGVFVEQQNLKSKVGVRVDERGLVISLLSDNMLFARGQANLQPASEKLLQQVAQIIQTVPNRVQIEGHTCNLPIRTALFPSNWELSSMRAGSVLRYFTERQSIDRQRFVAAGYADTKPLAANTNETNRARNRRVDIVIMKSEAQREADLIRKGEIQRITADPDPAPSDTGAPNETNREGP